MDFEKMTNDGINCLFQIGGKRVEGVGQAGKSFQDQVCALLN